MFDIKVFNREPEHFYSSSKSLACQIRNAPPNAGHIAIARLAKEFGKHVRVCTQNIDNLHQIAGAPEVYSLHGTLQSFHCQKCQYAADAETLWPLIAKGKTPRHAGCGGVMKPDIVFFGESLPIEAVVASEQAVRDAELLVVAGTSLIVQPVASLPSLRSADCRLVIINHAATSLDTHADLVFHESIGTVLAQALNELSGLIAR